MKPWPRTVAIGAGAVGSYFGGKLALAGAPVLFLGRPGSTNPHLAAIARDGLHIDAVDLDTRVAVETGDGIESAAEAELILFAVKSPDTRTAARSLAPHLRDGSVVVSLQNGVDNAETMREQGIDAIPAVVYVAAAIERPGTVKHRGRGDLVIGHPEREDDLARVAGWFEAAGVPCRISAAVVAEQWAKLTINGMGNAISALTGAPYARVLGHEPTWKVARQVARETFAVARAAGIPLDEEAIVEEARGIYRTLGAATSSTEQDIARGRRTEIDALNGVVVRKGRELGIATPVNEALWALVGLREETDAARRDRG